MSWNYIHTIDGRPATVDLHAKEGDPILFIVQGGPYHRNRDPLLRPSFEVIQKEQDRDRGAMSRELLASFQYGYLRVWVEEERDGS